VESPTGPGPVIDSSAAVKVPQITALFWITKLLTTAMGEATSDFLVKQLNPVVAVGLGGVALAATLVLQFRTPRYVPWAYWLAVVMVAVSGTMAADVLHIQFGVPYVVSSSFFAVVLAAVFVLWQRTEQTLSIHSVNTPRREAFYWATVMATFALGTAVGDLTATTLKLGYFASAVLFAVLITVPAVAYWRRRVNGILAFWTAYVLTRPLGASIADWLGKGRRLGGLEYGDGHVSVVLTVLITALVAYFTLGQRRVEAAPGMGSARQSMG
jgi:uncharacterized membrane-anchored protein